MTDIVDQLRSLFATHPLVMEAAAEIKRLRAALRRIVDESDSVTDSGYVARRALEQKEQPPMKETWAQAAAATASQAPDAFVEAIRDREQPAEEK